MQTDEQTILERCQAGDLDAFGELVARYQDRIYRTAYLLVGNRDDAQDVAQETFVRAFRSLCSFRRECAFSSWLHRILLNAARNWLRDNRRHAQISGACPPVIERSEETEASPEEALFQHDRASRLQAALRDLPLHYREAVVLRFYHDLSYTEISEVLDVPIGTVRSRLAKARDLLQKRLRWQALMDQDKEAKSR